MGSFKKISLIILSLLLLGAGVGFGLFFVGQRYSETILNEVIKRETNGYYRLDFESLKLDLLENRITVQTLKLTPDPSHDFSELGLKNLYEIGLTELIIDLESLYELYLEKELIIKNVRVVDPDIQMISLNSSEKTKFSFEAGSMYKAISDYLQVLKIDYFRIQDGELNYDGNRFALGEIDFLVKNLLMDSVSRENQVFYSEQIELEIRNQLFHLPDSIHEITFEKFVLSTSDSILSFENIRVKPTTASNITFEGNNDVNVYDIHVPKLSFKGVDYVAAYQNNHLIIEELLFENPTVFIDDESHAAKTKKNLDNSLLALIFQVFGSLDIGKLNIKNAHLDLKIDGEDYQRFKVEESNIVFHKIHLDTSNFRFDQRFKYFDDIELDIHNYTYLLPDSVHSAYFDLLRINSFDSELSFENVIVSHERSGNETKALVDIEIPLLKLKDIDFQRAIVDKVLNVGHFQMNDALIGVRETGARKKKKSVSVNTIYTAISPFFREIGIDRFDVANLGLTLPKNIELGTINLTLNSIYMNANSNSFSGLFEKTSLSVGDFSLYQDSVKISGGELLADDNLTSFEFIDWEVEVNKKSQYVAINLDTLQISNLELDSVISGNYTAFNRALLINPQIEFDIQSSSGKGGLEIGTEKELIISGGILSGSVDSLEMSMDGLDADIFIGDSTAFRSMGIENILIKSLPMNHFLSIKEWMYDTLNSEMQFHELKIDPIDNTDTINDLLYTQIPLIKLTAFEQSKLFDENHLFSDSLYLKNPYIKYVEGSKTKENADVRKDESLTLNIKNLEINKGDFSIIPFENNIDSLIVTGVSSSISDIDFPSENPFENGALYSSSLTLSIEDVKPFLKTQDTFLFKNLRYGSTTNNIGVDSIQYAALDRNLRLMIPSLELKKVDLELLINENEIVLDSLIIDNPDGMNRMTQKDDKNVFFTTPVSMDYLAIRNLSWNYVDTLKNQSYYFSNVNLGVDDFLTKDTLRVENIASNFSELKFDSGPLKLPLSDGYNLDLKSYEYTYPENKLIINGISLSSDFTAEEYSENLEFQNDWFNVSAQEVEVDGIDVDAFLGREKYAVKKISLSGLDALIYRDKEVPFPDDQVRDLPQKTIHSVSVPFQIDTLMFNGSLRYREKPKDYFTYGEISFNDMNGSLLNVGNTDLRENSMMLLNANGKLMDAGRFNARATFDMQSPANQFSLKGTIKDFPLDSMNRMLGPVANVNIKSGYAKELEFNFRADNSLARGEMKFRYNDLKLQILNVKTHDTKGFGQGIKTFFANTFVVKNRNPSYLLFLRKGTIFVERDTSRAIFNYWGKSLLSGVVSSVGVHKSDKAEKKFERNQDSE